MLKEMSWNNLEKPYRWQDAVGHGLLLAEGAAGGVLLGLGTLAIKSLVFVQETAVNILANNCTDFNDANPHHRLCDARYVPNNVTGYFGEHSNPVGVTLMVAGAGVVALSGLYIVAHRCFGSGEKNVDYINDSSHLVVIDRHVPLNSDTDSDVGK